MDVNTREAMEGAPLLTLKIPSILSILILFLTACDFKMSSVGDDVRKWVQHFKQTPTTTSTTTPSSTPAPAVSADIAKAHQELMFEMLSVVFGKKEFKGATDDRTELGSLTHSLNQGASIEGLYRGIIMGSRYRALESQSRGAAPKVIQGFARELVYLQSEMKKPTQFNEATAKKILEIDFPDGSDGAPENAATDTDPNSVLDEDAKIRQFNKMFLGASPYILKRILGEEALLLMDELKSDPKQLAQWYAKHVVHMVDKNLDYGLELRNKPDFDFHYQWAQKVSVDRIQWEVLNRLHRYLNSLDE